MSIGISANSCFSETKTNEDIQDGYDKNGHHEEQTSGYLKRTKGFKYVYLKKEVKSLLNIFEILNIICNFTYIFIVFRLQII